MKRIISALLTLALLLTGLCFAEGDQAGNPAQALVGIWSDAKYGRATLYLLPGEGGDAPTFDIWIRWGDSASSEGVWHMEAVYDGETRTLSYEGGTMTMVTYAEDGSAQEDVQYEDAVGVFTLTAQGNLTWQDSREERSADFILRRWEVGAPLTEDLAEFYFRRVAEVEQGTAGASLKQAAAACDVLSFAYGQDLWAGDIQTLRENMLAAWESLDADTQARFDENLLTCIVPLIDAALADYGAVAGQFEDAGMGDTMRGLLRAPETAVAWRTLLSHTLTMGNSDGE